MSEKKCPEEQVLSDYTEGLLLDEDAQDLEAHITECPLCDATLDNLDGRVETVLSVVRGSSLDDLPSLLEEQDYVRGIQELHQLPQQIYEATCESVGNADGGEYTSEYDIPERIGSYELLEVIGAGGMGVVCRAIAP